MTETHRTATVVALIAVLTAIYIVTIRQGHVWDGDFAMYIMHARNLVEGVDYKLTGYLSTDHFPDDYIGPQAYPPVFPLLLAPVYNFAGLDLDLYKALIIVCFALALWFIYLTFRDQGGGWQALALVPMLGLNPWVWDFKDNIRSDLPFLFFIYLTLFLAGRGLRAGNTKLADAGWGLATGIAIYLAYGTRPLGLTLLPALAVLYLMRGRRNSLFVFTTGILAIALLLWQKSFLNTTSSFTQPFTLDPDVVLGNLYHYSAAFSLFLDTGYSKWVRGAIFLPLAVFALIGFLHRCRRCIALVDLFPFIYVIPLIFYRYHFQERYILPLIPILFFYAAVGCHLTLSRLPPPLRRPITGLLLLTILFIYGLKYTTLDYPAIKEGVDHPAAVEMLSFVREQTDEDAVLVFFKPRVINLLTGRRAGAYYGFQDADRFQEYLSEIQADYLIIDDGRLQGTLYGTGPDFLHRFVEQRKNLIQQVFSNRDFAIYKLKARPG